MSSITNQHLARANSIRLFPGTSDIRASRRRNDFSLITKRSPKTPRGVVRISTADGRWHGKWNLDYNLSLQELQLQDLAEDGQKDDDVSVSLCIHKNVRFLANFITEGGIIIKRSKTRISAKAQRKVARAIKTARAFGLMPFTTMGTKQFVFGETMENRDEDFEFQTYHPRSSVDLDDSENPLQA